MSRKLFKQTVRDVTDHSPYFQQRLDCTGRAGIFSLIKCNFAIQKMTCEAVLDVHDEYLQIGATISRKCLVIFCDGIMELYGEEFL